MSEKFKYTWFRAPLDTYKKNTGIIRTKIEEFYTQRNVNFDDFSNLLAQKYNELDAEGYDVVNVIPIGMGSLRHAIRQIKIMLVTLVFQLPEGRWSLENGEIHNYAYLQCESASLIWIDLPGVRAAMRKQPRSPLNSTLDTLKLPCSKLGYLIRSLANARLWPITEVHCRSSNDRSRCQADL